MKFTTRTFDPASGHITGISSVRSPGTVIQSLQYDFDVLGNLLERRDLSQQTGERFDYDMLNRLTWVETTVPGSNGAQVTTKTISYDAKGNILTRSDVGAYTYGGAGASCSGLAGVASAGAHAVTAIVAAGVVGGKTADYCYDANGNLLRGDSRNVAWTAFDPGLRRGKHGVGRAAGHQPRVVRLRPRSPALSPRRHHPAGDDADALCRRQGDGSDHAPGRQRGNENLYWRLRGHHHGEQRLGDALSAHVCWHVAASR